MTSKPFRLQIELEADSREDAEAKLLDICHDLRSDRVGHDQVFASPSCSGIARWSQQPGAEGCSKAHRE